MGKKINKRVIIMALIMVVLTTTWALAIDISTRGDMVSFFRNITVPANIVVNGDVVSLFGNATVEGNVNGDVVAIFGTLNINGKVNGDAVSIFGGITVGPTGQINGGGVAILGHGIDNFGVIRQEEVSIMGFAPKSISPIALLLLLIFIFIFIKQLFAFGVSIIAVLLFNDRFDRMATAISDDPGKKFLIGILVYFGSFVAIAVLVMTVIGTPLIILLIPALLLLEFVGNTTAKIAIGRRIGLRLNKEWSIMMELIIGTLIYLLLEVSIIGKVVTVIFKFIGIGEIIDSRMGEGTVIGPKGV